ncbi:4Fe-4S binding protein [Tyzzerella sp. OttesenSCG-928-J15]|nr:4Fe-4S binding protein [Tyzzerella sp. OttesenSCG-928-J15]
MPVYLSSQTSNCKNCYKCIRYCPLKAIRFSGNQAHIMDDECILCGKCYNICPQGAKVVQCSIEKAKVLLGEAEIVAVSLAPSFAAYYDGVGIEAMETALKKLGFAHVFETALAATVVKKEYDRIIDEGSQKVLISSCCHSVNDLIQKYYPAALPFLARVKSPMQVSAAMIKDEFPTAKTVFIGPCISKKAEADIEPDLVDCVLTFEELDDWLSEEGIEIERCTDKTAKGGKTRYFPVTGGIIKSMECKNSNYNYISIDGVKNCIAAIEEIIAGNLTNCFIEMSACEGSCIGGPIMAKKNNLPVKNYIDIEKFAVEGDFEIKNGDVSIDKTHIYVGVENDMPGSGNIEEILKKMGKFNAEDELNCGSCGYNTCRDKAVAIYQGKADYAMCLPFLKDKAESFSDNIIGHTPNGIVVLNEALEVQQVNASALNIMNIQSAELIMGEHIVRILDPEIFLEVLESGENILEKPMFLGEYRKYVEMTIIYDKGYKILICIMRDVTSDQLTKERKEAISLKTIETADQVVEKQMRVVQEIALLLGETTAETKVALTKLKESISDE